MTDQELIQALRAHAEWMQDSELYLTYPVPYWCIRQAADRLANQNTHILALQKEIDGLRSQNEQLREASALLAKESAELLERRWIPVTERLPELQSWGASELVLGLIKNEGGYPPPNPTLCVYCGDGIWSMPGRYARITYWMPIPALPEEGEENEQDHDQRDHL